MGDPSGGTGPFSRPGNFQADRDKPPMNAGPGDIIIKLFPSSLNVAA